MNLIVIKWMDLSVIEGLGISAHLTNEWMRESSLSWMNESSKNDWSWICTDIVSGLGALDYLLVLVRVSEEDGHF